MSCAYSQTDLNSFTHSHQVLFGRPLSLVLSISTFKQCLTQSASSLRSTCPNHHNLPCIITKMTGSDPNNSQQSTFFFLSFNANPCIQLTRYHISIFIFISILSSFSSCFVFIGQVMLVTIHNYHQQASYVAHRIVAKLKLGRKFWHETIPNQTQLLNVLKDKWLVSEVTLRRSHSQPDSFGKLKTLSA